MKKIIFNIAISAVMGFAISFVINYFIVPIPNSLIAHAFGNGMSGFMSGFMGMLMFFIMNKNARKMM